MKQKKKQHKQSREPRHEWLQTLDLSKTGRNEQKQKCLRMIEKKAWAEWEWEKRAHHMNTKQSTQTKDIWL